MTEQSGAAPAVLREPAFRQLLTWEVQRAIRYQDFLTLCLVQLGPPISSTVREAVARKLVQTLRASDLVGIVGDDIAVLLVHTAEDEARALAKRMQRQVHEALRPGFPGAAATEITLRLAIASFPTDATNDTQLFAHARIGLAP